MFLTLVLFCSIAGVVSAADETEPLKFTKPGDIQYGYTKDSLKIETADGEVITLDSDNLAEFTNEDGAISIDSAEIEKYESLLKSENQITKAGGMTLTWVVSVYSPINIHLYDYEYEFYWAYDGTNITTTQKHTKPSIKAAGWRFEDETDSSYYYNGVKNYNTTRTGHFTLGIGGWDAQHMYPYITYKVNGAGGWTAEKGT